MSVHGCEMGDQVQDLLSFVSIVGAYTIMHLGEQVALISMMNIEQCK